MLKESRGFTLIELLIVVAIIGIIAAIAIPGLLRARIAGNEASAISSMRTIGTAEATFSSSCGGGGYATSLADLAIGPAAGDPFVPPGLAAAFPGGTPKAGYEFTISANGGIVILAPGAACNGTGAESSFFAIGDPASLNFTGTRFFGVDEGGGIRHALAQLADMTDGTPLQ